MENRRKVVALIEEFNHKELLLERALNVMGISTTRYYAWKKNPDATDKRLTPNRNGCIGNPNPRNKLSAQERQEIKDDLLNPAYSELSIAQVCIRALDDSGVYKASSRTYFRIAKQEGLSGKRRKPTTKTLPKGTERCVPCVVNKPNEAWIWDISSLPYSEQENDVHIEKTAYLFAVMDLYSRKVVHYAVNEDQTANSAVKFFNEAFAKNDILSTTPLLIHSDNGSAMRSDELLAYFNEYDLRVSYSRPRHSNDNPHIESFFGTLKGPMGLSFNGCHSIAECATKADKFIQFYNDEQYHSGIGYVTPTSRYEGKDEEILKRREQAQKRHYEQHPERYTGQMRKYNKAGSQCLNAFTPPRVCRRKTRMQP